MNIQDLSLTRARLERDRLARRVSESILESTEWDEAKLNEYIEAICCQTEKAKFCYGALSEAIRYPGDAQRLWSVSLRVAELEIASVEPPRSCVPLYLIDRIREAKLEHAKALL